MIFTQNSHNNYLLLAAIDSGLQSYIVVVVDMGLDFVVAILVSKVSNRISPRPFVRSFAKSPFSWQETVVKKVSWSQK